MEKKINKEVFEFNTSFKNTAKVRKSKGFVFISCPDFKNDGKKYNYVESIGDGLPLYMKLAGGELKVLMAQKPVHILLSDHELNYVELLNRMNESVEDVRIKLENTLRTIRVDFPKACFLSEKYSYESVVYLKQFVPKDENFNNEVINWGHESVSREQLEDRYLNRFSQMKAFMMFCRSENLCPVFLYSKFNFKIVSLVRKELHTPVFFLDVMS